MSEQKRQPKGVPVGGQFAASAHDEANSALSAGTTILARHVRKGDVVDMTDLVSSYVANSYDGVLDDEGDGFEMEGAFTVSDVEDGPSGSVRLTLSSPDYSYDWYLSPTADVPLLERHSVVAQNSQAGLAAWSESPRVTPQPMIGFSRNPSLVDVSAPTTGSGMTFEVGLAEGGDLTLYPKDLPALDASNAYDRVTMRNRGGELVAECEIDLEGIGSAAEGKRLDSKRDEINRYLENFQMRLPDHVADWSKTHLVREAPMDAQQFTYQGAGGDTRKAVYTDGIAEEVRENTSAGVNEWIREGRMTVAIREVAGLQRPER